MEKTIDLESVRTVHGPWTVRRTGRDSWEETPTEYHFFEVLALNPALRGWGEPLPVDE